MNRRAPESDMKKREEKKKNLKSRIIGIYALCLIAALIFVLRLIQLQFLETEKYKEAALDQRKKVVELTPERGEITDRFGNPLAISVKVNTCYLRPETVEKPLDVAAQLADILSIDLFEVQEMMTKKDEVKVKTRLSIEEAKRLREEKIQGVSVRTENARYYPNGTMAAHFIGFTNGENEGIYGIESTFEDDLIGVPGKFYASKSLRGDVIPYEETEMQQAVPGNSLTTTLDEGIQTIVDRRGRDAYGRLAPKNMSIIVMDPNTGDILAMQNFPGYDPNVPRQPRTEAERKEWSQLSGEKLSDKYYEVWRSFSVNDVYEPGSVFKLITTAAALEEGTTTPQTNHYHCSGTLRDIPGVVIRCHRWYAPHGKQTLKEALANSCNPAYVQIARELGAEKMLKYIRAFGFGEKTGIALPAEAKGLTPKTVSDINETELATLSYGHGIAASPIQILSSVCAVVNGGKLYEPRVVLEVADGEGNVVRKNEKVLLRQVISEETSRTMRDLMENCVLNGTANNGKIAGFKIGGKTGTSVKVVDGRYTSEKTTTSYAGVYPIDDPQYAILVVIDEPVGENGGNSTAGVLVREILTDLLVLKGEEPQEPEKVKNLTKVPEVIGRSLEEAARKLNEAGLQHTINLDDGISEKSLVVSQSIAPETEVEKGTIVDLHSDGEDSKQIEVPGLRKMTLQEAKYTLEKKGFAYTYEGEGRVSAQEPEKGALASPDTVVKFTLSK